jgi:ubiquinone/menaquinone biosynthesis C-methylase UbiE
MIARAAPPDLAVIADAFTRTAARYDAFAEDHPHLTRMRQQVYDTIVRTIPCGARILELNAGTGTDAVHVARLGYRVHATDIAPGMLARLHDKVERFGLDDMITSEALSFLDLDRVHGAPYDAVFSNLGGLNCTADLQSVARGIDRALRPGGALVLVVMPPVCLWELALVFTGQFRLATRRLRRGGRAHLEGRRFAVHYHTPRQVAAAFGAGYEMLSAEGLAVLTPTAESKGLATRHPRAYAALAALDRRVRTHAPFSRWGDFCVLVMRRRERA